MNVSEALLRAIAVRLAFLVLLGIAAKTFPPAQRHAAQPSHTAMAAAYPTGLPGWRDRARMDELTRDMFNHD